MVKTNRNASGRKNKKSAKALELTDKQASQVRGGYANPKAYQITSAGKDERSIDVETKKLRAK